MTRVELAIGATFQAREGDFFTSLTAKPQIKERTVIAKAARIIIMNSLGTQNKMRPKRVKRGKKTKKMKPRRSKTSSKTIQDDLWPLRINHRYSFFNVFIINWNFSFIPTHLYHQAAFSIEYQIYLKIQVFQQFLSSAIPNGYRLQSMDTFKDFLKQSF
ncbi:MAG: hypothetical protein AMJ43_09885 [Coxiella sp. DG_40]|nr:MAG: hypothetical protein AMJ43_09885 [Coxiella sp. DG_40]